MPTIAQLQHLLSLADQFTVVKRGFNHPHSYRGYYDQPAVEPARDVNVATMRGVVARLLTETFTGWKGGDFTYWPEQQVHLANEGETREFDWSPVILSIAITIIGDDHLTGLVNDLADTIDN